jgi:hypothetical protein
VYNSTTAKTPVTPTNEAKLDIHQSTVYDFLFGENYTLTTDSITNTFTSKAAACSNASVSSSFLVSSGGPLLFSKWGSEARVLEDLIPRISNALDVGTILDQTSSFFYRISYPKWGNGTLVNDPTYIANFHLQPPSNHNPGLGNLQTVAVIVTVGAGIAMLSIALLQLRKTPKTSSQQ